MTAFVAGATGLTGRSVVEQLAARGVPTVAHVRPDSPRLAEWTERFEGHGAAVDIHPWTPDGMRAAMQAHRPSHLFCLLGTTAKRSRAGDGDYRTVDFGLTVMAIDALEAAGLEQTVVIYLSSLGAEKPRGAYLQARADVEAHLRASGQPFVIARPSFIVGDRDQSRPGESVGAAVADAPLKLLGALGARRTADRLRSISGPELAAGLVRVAFEPARLGTVVDSSDLR